MKGIDTIMERLFRLAKEVDAPAQPKRGRTASIIYRSRPTKKARPPKAQRRRIRKAQRAARRRNRSVR